MMTLPEGPSLLRPVELKLAHANHLGRTLAESISTWTARNTLNVRCELLDQRLGFRLILEDFAELPPVDGWGLAAGDYVHNVRSALDNLAFALARTQRDPPARPNDIAFPIYQDEARFNRRGRRSIDQLPAPAIDLIERLQPFQRDGGPERSEPDRDELVVLQWLSNTDKHRVPPIMLLAPTGLDHRFALTFDTEEDAEAQRLSGSMVWTGPLTTGVVLLEQRTTRPVASVRGRGEGQAVVAIETPHGPCPATATLRSIGSHVWQVSRMFRQLFD
jgi:hypothetical protein